MDAQQECLICDRISQIEAGTNPYFVAELETGYVVVGDFQFFRGYTLFLYKQHVGELHDLEVSTKLLFLKEMSEVAEAVYRGFQPRKLNYELLGNSEPHLHWHFFPRYDSDPTRGPVWQVDKAIRYAENARPNSEELFALKNILLVELTRIVPTDSIKRLFEQ